MAMLTAELSSALPSNSGMIQWTNCAFGRFSRFFTSQTIFMSIVISVTDNAVYPALFVDYLLEMVDMTPLLQVCISTVQYT